MNTYKTEKLETERLIIDKGDSYACKKIYEYDLTKCTGIDGQNELIKFEEPIDFIGDNQEQYYKECEENKIFDWYVYLKDNKIPVANILADREENGSIEISYNVHPNYWGNGYAPEAIREIIKYLHSVGYIKILIHFYDGNEKSKRVCEKLGFKFVNREEKYYQPTNKKIYENEYALFL